MKNIKSLAHVAFSKTSKTSKRNHMIKSPHGKGKLVKQFTVPTNGVCVNIRLELCIWNQSAQLALVVNLGGCPLMLRPLTKHHVRMRWTLNCYSIHVSICITLNVYPIARILLARHIMWNIDSTDLGSFLLITWPHTEPGHQQVLFWPCLPGVFCCPCGRPDGAKYD